ncbi:MAG: hypothetical protein ACXQS8_10000 [Candidatus Helarchaeales archaeon]
MLHLELESIVDLLEAASSCPHENVTTRFGELTCMDCGMVIDRLYDFHPEEAVMSE